MSERDEIIVDVTPLEVGLLILNQAQQKLAPTIASENIFENSKGESEVAFEEFDYLLNEIGNTLFDLTEGTKGFIHEALEQFQESDTKIAASLSASFSLEGNHE